jgi:hypothetical protein
MIEANHSGFDASALYNQAIQYGTVGNANGKAEYVGFAAPGALTSQAKWLVKKITYDSSGRTTLVQVAHNRGDAGFNNVFDSPDTLPYT